MRELDLELFRSINLGWRNPVFDVVFAFFSYAGLGFAPVALAVALLALPRCRATGIALILTLLIGALGLVHLIKGIYERDRPSNLAFAIVQEPHLHGSFPSGHSTTAFAVAFTLLFVPPGTRYDRLWIVLGFVYAIMVGLSRMYRGVHWPTDVLGGICLAAFSAALAAMLVRVFRRPAPEPAES